MSTVQRDELSAEVRHRYANDESLRSIAAHVGRSYGTVHRLLREAGVTLRPRGGRRIVAK
jgi:hypothetical protein